MSRLVLTDGRILGWEDGNGNTGSGLPPLAIVSTFTPREAEMIRVRHALDESARRRSGSIVHGDPLEPTREESTSLDYEPVTITSVNTVDRPSNSPSRVTLINDTFSSYSFSGSTRRSRLVANSPTNNNHYLRLLRSKIEYGNFGSNSSFNDGMQNKSNMVNLVDKLGLSLDDLKSFFTISSLSDNIESVYISDNNGDSDLLKKVAIHTIKNGSIGCKASSSFKGDGFDFRIRNKFSRFFVAINNVMYFKLSDDVVKVGGSYFRRKSSKIVKTIRGSYCLVKDAIELYNGGLADRNHDRIKKAIFNDKKVYCLSEHVIAASDGILYVKESKELLLVPERVINETSFKQFYDVDKYISTLNPSHYHGKDLRVRKGDCDLCSHTKSLFLNNDLLFAGVDKRSNRIHVNKFDAPKVNIGIVAYSIERGSRDLNEIRFYNQINPDLDNDLIYSKELNAYYSKTGHSDKVIIRSISDSSISSSNMLKSISEFGAWDKLDFIKDESPAKRIQMIRGDISGGHEYFKASNFFRRNHFSQTLSKTGGKDYSFGVEHESCVGLFPDYLSEQYGLTRVGDGSTRFTHRDLVRHYEYVTSVLHGDIGIDRIYKYLPLMSEYILQNDRCSTHIHIGGASQGGLSTDIPKFNRRFSAYAIKLGTQVEASLAALLPESRNPRKNRYCRSILDFANLGISNKSDINNLIARFVFDSNRLDSNLNNKSSLGKWCNSRYKWLNLVNCNTNNSKHRTESFSTIEFRIFPPTTNPSKIHFWILICQAFVWFVENRQREIMDGGITIERVLDSAYKGTGVYDFVNRSLIESKNK